MTAEKLLEHQGAILLAQSDGCAVWQFRNGTGDGTMTTYEVFPGVMLAFNDFHMEHYECDFVADRRMLAIDHCREGRMEYAAGDNLVAYTAAGDMKLDRREQHTGTFHFPSCHYHGLTVAFDRDIVRESLPREVKDFPATPEKIIERWQLGSTPRVVRGAERMEHIFGEMYRVPKKIRIPYFKVKILELLLCLDAMTIPQEESERPYFYKTQVEKVEAIKRFLIEHVAENFTQEELSSRFDIPMTPMKTCFRSVYGAAIGTWLKNYRMNLAAGLAPFYCMYAMLCLFVAGTATAAGIIKWCLLALLAYAVKILLFSLSTGVSHAMAYTILEALRLRLADRFLHAPLGDVENHSIGEIKSMMIDKIENLEPPLAHMIPEGAGHIVLPVVSILALLCIDWRLALASLVTFPLSFLCMGLTFKISGESFSKYDRSASYMNSTIVEYIEGIEVIRAFGRAGVSYEKYAGAINDFRTFVVRWLTSTFVTMKLSFALFPSTLIGTLPAALALADRGTITAPQAALAVMLSISMVGSLAKLEVFSENMRQVKFTVENLQEFLEMPSLPEPAQRAKVEHTDVALKNVRFSYTGEEKDEVLHGIDLTLPEGSFTALVGPSGGGKSTVAKLIARFWDVSSGEITVGGVNVKDMPLSQLSEYVSFVTQNNFLFNCSLPENIRLGDPGATDEQVRAAARAAQCEEFIEKLPQGYDTPAGEAGKRLSGGENQRIAIARMMLKNAPIVILDEATAFTDPENEDKLQRSIAALTKGKTLLVIAHRLSTIKNADNIVVLKNGAIEAAGTQEELLASCPLYKDMWLAHIGAQNWAVSAAEKEA